METIQRGRKNNLYKREFWKWQQNVPSRKNGNSWFRKSAKYIYRDTRKLVILLDYRQWCHWISRVYAVRMITKRRNISYWFSTIWKHLRMFWNSIFTITMFKWWILLKPVLHVGGVDGSLHSPLPSINRPCKIFNFVNSIKTVTIYITEKVFVK